LTSAKSHVILSALRDSWDKNWILSPPHRDVVHWRFAPSRYLCLPLEAYYARGRDYYVAIQSGVSLVFRYLCGETSDLANVKPGGNGGEEEGSVSGRFRRALWAIDRIMRTRGNASYSI
jgi:hypothetical protein